jgi:hypothetical protein
VRHGACARVRVRAARCSGSHSHSSLLLRPPILLLYTVLLGLGQLGSEEYSHIIIIKTDFGLATCDL